MIARLRHPNIVQIYDVGEAGGRPYFVLEFVAGGSLAQHLQGTPQPARPAALLVETPARAIHAAHANGVIHRDLKPANILLRERGGGGESRESLLLDPRLLILTPSLLTPRLPTSALAKCRRRRQRGTPDLRGPTVTGTLLGTPTYMAPEQAMMPRQPAGPAADVYALGAILCEPLISRLPLHGETPLATVPQVLNNEPISVTSPQPSVPPDLETICLKCLRKEPRQRYGSALELAGGSPAFPRRTDPGATRRGAGEARAGGRATRHRRTPRRRPAWAGGGTHQPVAAVRPAGSLQRPGSRRSKRELPEVATKEYSRNVQRAEKASFTVNKTVPPTPALRRSASRPCSCTTSASNWAG